MPVPARQHTSLGEAAYRQLRSDIVSCRLAPGERLTERALADSTGFGVAPIRDALTRLDHEGLVRTLPRKGYQVAPLTLKSVDDLFAIWQIVGPAIARQGVREANSEQRRRAVAVLTAMAELRRPEPTDDRDRVLRMAELDGEFFDILVTATDNDHLIAVSARIRSEMARVWVLVSEADVPLPALVVDEEWIDIVRRGDGEAASARVQAAIAEAHGRILRVLSRWPSVVSSEITSLRR
ncbi:GntR family transcriptional regulator [Streptomyces sp. NPDC013157]|uniref:GntR family transcriptional regulator n=1 Tax=Streptomyces sp. NPDC013157 TaxID=3364861 RepID=UPI003695BBF4